MRAIKVTAPGKAELVSDAPTPRLRSGYMLARPKAWAINPTDHHHIAGLSGPGATIGVNYSGVVLEVGPDVTQFQPGDEVLGGCHGGNNDEPEDGAFGEVVAAKESATLHKPAAMSWEEAATLMTPIYTVGQCLVHVMGLNEENGKGKDVLVYGGSSATGSVAIQVLKHFGCNVLTTCSPNNFDLVKSRGADHVFNYRDPDCLEQIQKVAGDDVMYILDCIGSEESGALCAKALSSKGGRYHSVHAPLLPVVKDMRPEDTVIATTALAYTLNGKKFRFANPPMEFEAVPEDYQFALRWKKIVEGWLERGGLKPHPPEVKPGGIEGILEQLMALTDKSPSGKRIVLSAAN